MAVWCTMLPTAMHHFGGIGASLCQCRTGGKGVYFMRSGCRTINGQGVVLARCTQCTLLCTVRSRSFRVKVILADHVQLEPAGLRCYGTRLFQLEQSFMDLTMEECYTKRLEPEKPVGH